MNSSALSRSYSSYILSRRYPKCTYFQSHTPNTPPPIIAQVVRSRTPVPVINRADQVCAEEISVDFGRRCRLQLFNPPTVLDWIIRSLIDSLCISPEEEEEEEKKMPHIGNHGEKKEKEAPKGCMPVRVGQEGEEQRRFVVPVAYLSHPLFAELLEEAAEEYGFSQRGAIAIPCGVDHFRNVQDVIGRERSAGPGGLLHHHRHHHHGQAQHSHHHHRLPHLAGCFGA